MPDVVHALVGHEQPEGRRHQLADVVETCTDARRVRMPYLNAEGQARGGLQLIGYALYALDDNGHIKVYE